MFFGAQVPTLVLLRLEQAFEAEFVHGDERQDGKTEQSIRDGLTLLIAHRIL